MHSKIILFVLFCLVAPSMPAEAQNPTCGDWWNPCCPWWDKSLWDAHCMTPPMPPPVDEHKKNVARANVQYFTSARDFFQYLGNGLDYLPGGGLAGKLVRPLQAYTQRQIEASQKIVDDPWDPNYRERYQPRYLSAEELG